MASPGKPAAGGLVLTAFGARGDATADAALLCLYGSQQLSDKDLKKIAKYEKFLAKEQKAKEDAAKKKNAGPSRKEKAKAEKAAKAAKEQFVYRPAAEGEKPNTDQMNKTYNPPQVEQGWYVVVPPPATRPSLRALFVECVGGGVRNGYRHTVCHQPPHAARCGG